MASHSISIDSYNRLKNDYHLFKQQNEEIQKDLNKTIKQTKDAIDLLKRENAKLKNQNINYNTLSKNQIIQKLKEEKILLSKKIEELENEKFHNIHHEKNNRLNNKNLIKNFVLNSFSFSLINNDKSNNYLKENIQKKKEEIIALKNELIKKEQIIQKLKTNNNNNNLIRYKSENHFININNSNLNYLLTEEKNDNNHLNYNKNINKTNKKENNEFNYILTNEDEEENYLEKNIQLELKNILEEKRNFILKTLTSENFSFDLIPKKINNLKSAKKNISSPITKKNNNINVNNNNNNCNSYTNNNNFNVEEINNNIDKMLDLINKRKKDIEQERKYLEDLKVKDQYN